MCTLKDVIYASIKIKEKKSKFPNIASLNSRILQNCALDYILVHGNNCAQEFLPVIGKPKVNQAAQHAASMRFFCLSASAGNGCFRSTKRLLLKYFFKELTVFGR